MTDQEMKGSGYEVSKYQRDLRKKPGTRKIADLPIPCNNREHNPPSMAVFEPGVYEHICPGCGQTQVFTVSGVTL